MFMETKKHIDFSNNIVGTNFNAIPTGLAKLLIYPNEFRLIGMFMVASSTVRIHTFLRSELVDEFLNP